MDKSTSLSRQNKEDRLATVEGNVRRTLKPVLAPPAFREHLRDGLMMAAQHQQAHRNLGYTYARQPGSTPRWWMVAAAILGSLIGFIVIQLYQYNAHRKAF